MDRWEIDAVDKLIQKTLSEDATIKTKMGITGGGKARVSGYRVVRDASYFPYIYFYAIVGPDTPGQGTTRIQSNPDYDIEVRTLGAPTDDSEAIVNRIDELIGTMKAQLTIDGKWVVSARRRRPISMVQSGETADIYYTRRGGTYKLSVVRA